jgi:DNA ligase 1
VHKGALHKVEAGKGIALRFPRFIRERADKNPEDATNAEQVADAYRSQALVESTAKAGKGKGGAEEDDDDDWCI